MLIPGHGGHPGVLPVLVEQHQVAVLPALNPAVPVGGLHGDRDTRGGLAHKGGLPVEAQHKIAGTVHIVSVVLGDGQAGDLLAVIHLQIEVLLEGTEPAHPHNGVVQFLGLHGGVRPGDGRADVVPAGPLAGGIHLAVTDPSAVQLKPLVNEIDRRISLIIACRGTAEYLSGIRLGLKLGVVFRRRQISLWQNIHRGLYPVFIGIKRPLHTPDAPIPLGGGLGQHQGPIGRVRVVRVAIGPDGHVDVVAAVTEVVHKGGVGQVDGGDGVVRREQALHPLCQGGRHLVISIHIIHHHPAVGVVQHIIAGAVPAREGEIAHRHMVVVLIFKLSRRDPLDCEEAAF